MLLTKKHLALICAALKFWDEEMSPHDTESYRAYFEGDALDYLPTKEETAWFREQLRCCELRYAVCNKKVDKLIKKTLFESPEEAQADTGKEGLIATVVFME